MNPRTELLKPLRKLILLCPVGLIQTVLKPHTCSFLPPVSQSWLQILPLIYHYFTTFDHFLPLFTTYLPLFTTFYHPLSTFYQARSGARPRSRMGPTALMILPKEVQLLLGFEEVVKFTTFYHILPLFTTFLPLPILPLFTTFWSSGKIEQA